MRLSEARLAGISNILNLKFSESKKVNKDRDRLWQWRTREAWPHSIPCCWNMSMVCGEVWTGSEWVRCTELRLWLGMLLLPPGLANHRFYGGKNTNCHYGNATHPGRLTWFTYVSAKWFNRIPFERWSWSIHIKTPCPLTLCTVLRLLIKLLNSPVFFPTRFPVGTNVYKNQLWFCQHVIMQVNTFRHSKWRQKTNWQHKPALKILEAKNIKSQVNLSFFFNSQKTVLSNFSQATWHKLPLKCSSNDRNTDLSTLACQRRTSECVAWRCSPDPAGTEKTHAPGWESTGGHLELPLAPPRYTSAHRSCCGEGVGPIGPAGVKRKQTHKKWTYVTQS